MDPTMVISQRSGTGNEHNFKMADEDDVEVLRFLSVSSLSGITYRWFSVIL